MGKYRKLVEPVLPVIEESITPLEAGPTSVDVALARLETVSILRARVVSQSIGVTILDPSVFAFVLWAGTGECRINGQRAEASKVYMPGAHHGFHICGGRREILGVAVPRSQLIQSVATLRGVNGEDAVLGSQALELPAGFAPELRRRVSRILEHASAGPNGGPSLDHAHRVCREVFGSFLDALLHNQPPTPTRARSPEQIVRKAEERFFDAGECSVSLADLCAAAKVSQASLYRAFEEVCGEAPLSYFRKRRMLSARSMLVGASSERGVIKRAALSSGLTHLGRFAVEYRQLFGESPSVTLTDQPPG